jgi:chaperonin GroEL (HSP60 family)
VAAGVNLVYITRGIERTTKALVGELQKMSKEVTFGYDLIMFRKYISEFLGSLFIFAIEQSLHYNTFTLNT